MRGSHEKAVRREGWSPDHYSDGRPPRCRALSKWLIRRRKRSKSLLPLLRVNSVAAPWPMDKSQKFSPELVCRFSAIAARPCARSSFPYRPSNPSAWGPSLSDCASMCLGPALCLQSVAPTLDFPNPFTDAATARLCPRAKVDTPTEDSEIWESLLENSATDEY